MKNNILLNFINEKNNSKIIPQYISSFINPNLQFIKSIDIPLEYDSFDIKFTPTQTVIESIRSLQALYIEFNEIETSRSIFNIFKSTKKTILSKIEKRIKETIQYIYALKSFNFKYIEIKEDMIKNKIEINEKINILKICIEETINKEEGVESVLLEKIIELETSLILLNQYISSVEILIKNIDYLLLVYRALKDTSNIEENMEDIKALLKDI